MDLHQDVHLKKALWTFETYVATVQGEQASSMAWLRAPESTWTVPGGLVAKVAPDGRLLPFHGDTVVLELGPSDIEVVAERMRLLEARVPHLLAEPLATTELHVTLHDLSNGPDRPALDPAMARNEARCREIFARLDDHFTQHLEDSTVRLVSTRSYPSVSTSVVLGFVPASDRDFRVVMNTYNLFDDVVWLGYWLRPHVTLAYFRPRPLDPADRAGLAEALDRLDAMGPVVLTLDLRELAYQHFADMNTYRTITTVGRAQGRPA